MKTVHLIQRLFNLLLQLGMIGMLFVLSCEKNSTMLDPREDSLRSRLNLQALEDIPYPPDNQKLEERIYLGKLLFYDPILGGEKDVSCATCHHPDFAFADGRQLPAGTSGRGLGPSRTLGTSAVSGLLIELTPRNSPTIFNAACNHDETGLPSFDGIQFWDGRSRSLEAQATRPITSREEMRGDAYPDSVAVDSVIARLRNIPLYELLFKRAFPREAAIIASSQDGEIITAWTYARAIAAFERELVTGNAPYDRYVRGDDSALSPQQVEGMKLFFDKAHCDDCHSGPMFSDFRFVVQGVPQIGPGKDRRPGDDYGREEHTLNASDRYAFGTPTLRNVELTAPYMHDGVFATLDDVLHFYNEGAHPRHPAVSDEMLHPTLRKPLGLSASEMAAILAFMRSFTDVGIGLSPDLLTVPDQVPSGLTPVVGLGAG